MLGIIIQARLGSSRLPKKMTLPFYNEMGVLEIILNNISNEIPNVPLVVATTTNLLDDEIVNICKTSSVDFFRGEENNVLKRFVDTANKYQYTKIIRICADNPFLDITALKILIDDFKMNDVDYCSFKTSKGKPTILTHYGFWAEGISLSALEEVSGMTIEPLYLEHVTNYIHSNPSKFNIKLMSIPAEIEEVKDLRMTLDTEEDFILLKKIYAECVEKNIKAVKDIVSLTKENKNWLFQMKEQIKFNTK